MSQAAPGGVGLPEHTPQIAKVDSPPTVAERSAVA
jgi:hypothetical protein